MVKHVFQFFLHENARLTLRKKEKSKQAGKRYDVSWEKEFMKIKWGFAKIG